jgi:carbonic anhydrase/acetyltransferase-like protein (isoleucine patch superfamily)
MIFSSGAKKPKIHSSAYVAPTATISGDVTIGAECAVLHGAVITAEGAPVTIGSSTVIMENAVLKASGGSALQFPLSVGDRCIVGPHAYLVGATIGNGCLVASGAKIFNGATLEDGSGVALGAIVEVGACITARPGTPAEHLAKIFNLEPGDDAHARAAETYAKFQLKVHAQDAALEEHRNVKPPPPLGSARGKLRAGEEPPPTQATQVDKVVDVMMLELEEMEHRRQEAIKRQKGG